MNGCYDEQTVIIRYPDLQRSDVRDVLQAKLYSLSKGCMLSLYRYMMRKLNVDAVNIVLQYMFGDMRRVRGGLSDEESETIVICRGNILSEKDLDVFLLHELF